MTENESNGSKVLQAAAAKRIELKHALSQVEIAAASPAGKPGWRQELTQELEDLRVALSQHVAEVEGDDGLLAELTAEAPRLVNQIALVRAEHPELCREVADTISHVTDGYETDDVRSEVLDLIVSIASHRQKGADLVYEAYNIDIGGS